MFVAQRDEEKHNTMWIYHAEQSSASEIAQYSIYPRRNTYARFTLSTQWQNKYLSFSIDTSQHRKLRFLTAMTEYSDRVIPVDPTSTYVLKPPKALLLSRFPMVNSLALKTILKTLSSTEPKLALFYICSILRTPLAKCCSTVSAKCLLT